MPRDGWPKIAFSSSAVETLGALGSLGVFFFLLLSLAEEEDFDLLFFDSKAAKMLPLFKFIPAVVTQER